MLSELVIVLQLCLVSPAYFPMKLPSILLKLIPLFYIIENLNLFDYFLYIICYASTKEILNSCGFNPYGVQNIGKFI